jgi:hypothetical protein
VHSPAGQAAIELREALWRGHVDQAASLVGALDRPHLVEVLLGGALRHGADGFAAVGAWRRATREPADPAGWRALCAALALPGDPSHDQRAAGWVASGLAPETVPVDGPALAPDPRFTGPEAEAALLAALAAGAAVRSVLAVWPPHPLREAVAAYYEGGIAALGARPLLYLAIVPASTASRA